MREVWGRGVGRADAHVGGRALFSCGRNGVVNEYELSELSEGQPSGDVDGGALRLSVLRSWRCSEATILECLLPTHEGVVALGFMQTEALLWHVHSRQELARWQTKGYRHPKDAAVVWSSGARGAA